MLNGSVQPGYGVLAGLTFRFLRAGIDLDLNFTWRQRPSRVVEGLLYSDMMVLMNLTRTGIRVQRQ